MRVAATEYPLIEEQLHRPAGGVLDGLPEIVGLHRLPSVGPAVVLNRLPPQLVAQLVADHVQHQRAFLVGMAVKHFRGIFITVGNYGPAVVFPVFLQIALLVALHFHEEFAPALIVLDPQGIEIGGEGLIEPQVIPVFGGEQIAPPLMDQFVGHQSVAAEIHMSDLIVQGIVGHGGGADVLHAAPHEICDGGLGVLFIGIIDADHRRIILHHIGGAAEGSFHQVLITRVHVVQHRDAAPFVPHLGEIAHYQ